MTLVRLSELIGITVVNLSVLKMIVRTIRDSTLEAICVALDCEIGDLFVLRPREA